MPAQVQLPAPDLEQRGNPLCTSSKLDVNARWTWWVPPEADNALLGPDCPSVLEYVFPNCFEKHTAIVFRFDPDHTRAELAIQGV